MKYSFSILILPLLALSSLTQAESNGKQLFTQHCAVCHGITGGMDMKKRIAPPIAAVKMHYLETFQDEDSFVSAVSSWVAKPNKDDSLMKGAIKHFNIMPQIVVPQNDVEKIATYIYKGNINKPKGMETHIKERHEKKM